MAPAPTPAAILWLGSNERSTGAGPHGAWLARPDPMRRRARESAPAARKRGRQWWGLPRAPSPGAGASGGAAGDGLS